MEEKIVIVDKRQITVAAEQCQKQSQRPPADYRHKPIKIKACVIEK